MRLWTPVLAVATSETSVEAMREVFESVLARLPVPPDVSVRPVTAGGVPALVLGDEPAILYLHGGGYALGSAYGYRSLAGALVVAAGRGALVADYRLAPEHPFPAAVDDALAAYRWLAERRGRVALAGDSSGAALALSLLQRLKAAGEPLPAAAALLCPSIDTAAPPLLAHLPYITGHPPGADLAGLPPLLIQAATGDRARPEAQALAQRARDDGVAVTFELYPTDVHVFHIFWSFLPEAADALAQAGAFLGAP
jgi:acetyl esterase/lipase